MYTQLGTDKGSFGRWLHHMAKQKTQDAPAATRHTTAHTLPSTAHDNHPGTPR